ncbi:MAG: EamA family transporter [Hyphomicrobiaceae bacterium]
MLIALISLCVAFDVSREVLFKYGVTQAIAIGNSRVGGLEWLRPHAWTMLGILVWAAEIVLWAQVLTHLPLNIAVPIMSTTYALAPVAGAIVFSEKISRNRWAGIALVTSGAMLVGAAGINT